ncbi:MAG: Bax inhibitor-1/YccA family protein [Lawsonella sp.]
MALRSTNPVMKSVRELEGNQSGQQQQGAPWGQNQGPYQGYNQQQGYEQFAGAHAGFSQGAMNYGQEQMRQEFQGYSDRPIPTQERAITIDDVVVKTGITLAVIVAFSVASFFLGANFPALQLPFIVVGSLGSLITVLVATFGKKMNSKVVTLVYAGLEGTALGTFSFLLAGIAVGDVSAASLIFSAIAGTIGVFVGMLVVYRSGAIRVTPKFTRFILAALGGVIAVILANVVISLFTGNYDIFGLYAGGPVAIIFSLFCIVLAAVNFLIDFDQADKAVRAGIPASYAWGIALGLAVTLVWLYTEILRLLAMLAARD